MIKRKKKVKCQNNTCLKLLIKSTVWLLLFQFNVANIRKKFRPIEIQVSPPWTIFDMIVSKSVENHYTSFIKYSKKKYELNQIGKYRFVRINLAQNSLKIKTVRYLIVCN